MSSLTDLIRDVVLSLVGPRLDPLAFYPARVVSMGDDGTVDVKPESARLGPGLAMVPVRHGLPGVTARVRAGAQVLVGFEVDAFTGQASIKRPYCVLWDPGSLESLLIEASVSLTLRSPSVVAAQVESNARRVARAGDLVKMTFVSGPPGAPIEAVGYIMDGAQKLKAE